MKKIKYLIFSSLLLAAIASTQANTLVELNKAGSHQLIKKSINETDIYNYLVDKGYTNISNIQPIGGTTNWQAIAVNPQGRNVRVIIFTDGWNIIGHEEIWIR